VVARAVYHATGQRVRELPIIMKRRRDTHIAAVMRFHLVRGASPNGGFRRVPADHRWIVIRQELP
jgi:hypothetical protein